MAELVGSPSSVRETLDQSPTKKWWWDAKTYPDGKLKRVELRKCHTLPRGMSLDNLFPCVVAVVVVAESCLGVIGNSKSI